jgi:hypothetical protein
METTELRTRQAMSWLPAFTVKTLLLDGVQSQILSWDALEADLAQRTHFHGCLTLWTDNLQVRVLYLDGLKVGMTWACRSHGMTTGITDLRRHNGRVSLHELELNELLRLVRHDALAVRTVLTETGLTFGGEGLIEYLNPGGNVGHGLSSATGTAQISTAQISTAQISTAQNTAPILNPATSALAVVVANPEYSNDEPSLASLGSAWTQLLLVTTKLLAQGVDGSGISAFERTWRSSCTRLADQFPSLDPFAAEIEWNGTQLLLEIDHVPEAIQALTEAYLRTILALGATRTSAQNLGLQALAQQHPNVGFESLILRIEQGH